MERLLSLLRDGFWMQNPNPSERLKGYNTTKEGAGMEYQAFMTCFTELKPTQSANHSKRYGLLGLVVDRQFVLDRRGGPVHYVKSNEDDIIVGNFISTHRWIHEQSLRLLEMANILEACSEISDEVKIKATNDAKDAVTVFDNLSFQCAFFKHMSTEETNDFKYLEEHEWRIVHGDGIEKAGLIINTTKDLPKYRIPLQPSDFQMLIIPDIIMRNQIVQAKQCQEIRDWFEGNLPTMITVEQLQHL